MQDGPRLVSFLKELSLGPGTCSTPSIIAQAKFWKKPRKHLSHLKVDKLERDQCDQKARLEHLESELKSREIRRLYLSTWSSQLPHDVGNAILFESVSAEASSGATTISVFLQF